MLTHKFIKRGLVRFSLLVAAVLVIVGLDVMFKIFPPYTMTIRDISRPTDLRTNIGSILTKAKIEGLNRLPDISKGILGTPLSSQMERRGVLFNVPEVFRFADSDRSAISSTDSSEREVPANVAELLRAGLNCSQYEILIDLLYTFDKVTKENNITYFLSGGSLLGSWRCHCLLQWDDDIDLLINTKDRPRVLKALRKLAPVYSAVDHKDTLIKFYKTANSSSIPAAHWRWPFIDVSFYIEDGEYIRETNPWWKFIKLKCTDIFPLHYRPFEGLDILAPKHSMKILKRLYGNIVDNCATQKYSHRNERMGKGIVVVKCHELKGFHPLVVRTLVTNGQDEALMMGEREIYRKFVNTSRTIQVS